jgi:hypothetical protein
MALGEQSDGTKVVTLASNRLFELYMAQYGAGQPPSSDLNDCKQAFRDGAADGPPGMMVWLDAGWWAGGPDRGDSCGGGLRGAGRYPGGGVWDGRRQPALLKAFATTLPMAAPAGQTVPAPTEAKLSLYPGYHVNADVPVRGGSSGDYHPVHWDGV